MDGFTICKINTLNVRKSQHTLCFGIELMSAFHDCASFQTLKLTAPCQVELRKV
jgi:hypothetical protein